MGIVPGLGLDGGIIDTFVIDRFKSTPPNLFFNNIEDRLSKNKININDSVEIKIPVREKVIIDNSKECEFNLDILIYNKISTLADKIIEADSLELANKYLVEAENLYNQQQTFNTLVAYLSCMVNYSTKDKIYSLNMIKSLNVSLEEIITSIEEEYLNILIDTYTVIFINCVYFYELNENIIPLNKNIINTKYFNEYITCYLFDSLNTKVNNTLALKQLSSLLLYTLGKTTCLYDENNITKLEITNNKLEIKFKNT